MNMEKQEMNEISLNQKMLLAKEWMLHDAHKLVPVSGRSEYASAYALERKGLGRVVHYSELSIDHAFFQMKNEEREPEQCPRCGGSGEDLDNSCPRCSGRGYIG
jgi:ribosomal protein S27AE